MLSHSHVLFASQYQEYLSRPQVGMSTPATVVMAATSTSKSPSGVFVANELLAAIMSSSDVTQTFSMFTEVDDKLNSMGVASYPFSAKSD